MRKLLEVFAFKTAVWSCFLIGLFFSVEEFQGWLDSFLYLSLRLATALRAIF